MPTTTRTETYGVVDVTYDEEAPMFSNHELTFPDGFIAVCDADWIVDQIRAGAFLLVSLVNRDELQRRLG
jgi:hypothetical protein